MKSKKSLPGFQSGILLPFARRLMLVLASLAFFAGVLAMIAAAGLWISAPRPGQPKAPQPSVKASFVRSSLEAAAPLEFIILDLNESELRESAEIAKVFSNESGNEAVSARLSDKADGALFDLSQPTGANGEMTLMARREFVDSFLLDPENSQSQKEYEIAISYTDKRGKTSEAEYKFHVPVRINRRRGASTVKIAPPEPEPSGSIDVDSAAQNIALLADPTQTTKYFDIYLAAQEAIYGCASDADAFARFVKAETDKNKLAFSDDFALLMLGRLCGIWNNAEEDAYAAYEQQKAKIEKLKQKGTQQKFFSRFIGLISLAAFGLLLSLILPLTLLAIEDHLKAIRTED